MSSACIFHFGMQTTHGAWNIELALAERSVAAGDAERKVALLLEHGVRNTRRAAEKFVAHRNLQRFDVADFQHRIELLRMYGCALDAIYARMFQHGLMTKLLPLLAYLEQHKYAPTLLPPSCETLLLFLIMSLPKPIYVYACPV